VSRDIHKERLPNSPGDRLEGSGVDGPSPMAEGRSSFATVKKIWEEVLGRDNIGADENFFDLGGDSLRAMDVISRLSGQLDVDLPLVAFFEDPTIRHIAKVIAALKAPVLPTTQMSVARVWTEVLGRENIGTTENFFDLGGDSLRAMEVISRLSGSLKVELPLVAFFEDPTIAHLASVIDELKPRFALNTQEVVKRAFAKVLSREDIGLNDNFFDAGGDSLRAMEVISSLSAHLKVELPLVAFFEDPTISHLAAVIDELQKGSVSPVTRSSKADGNAPVSFAQLTFWLLQQQDSASSLYTERRLLRVRGKFDPSLLQRSLRALCQRHQVLRSRFVLEAEEPVQQIQSTAEVDFKLEDLHSVAPERREEIALAAAREQSKKSFDLSKDAPIRTRLWRLGSEDHILLIVTHHIVGDGQTGVILFNELGTIYSSLAKGGGDELPDLPVQYHDYASWERLQMRGPNLDTAIEFWRSYLKDAPGALNLPTDKPRPETPDSAGDIVSVTISAATVERLQRLSKASGSTLFTVMLGALRILLSRWTGQQDIVLGTVASNRRWAGADQLIGCFVNFLPLRNTVNPQESVADLLHRERQSVMDAFAHQDCPFLKIVTAVGSSRVGQGNPIYNVAFLLQNFPEMKFRSESFTSDFLTVKTETALLDLRFIGTQRLDGLQLDCEFKTLIFERSTVEGLLNGFAGVLESIAADPALPVAKIPIPHSLIEQAEAARKRERHSRIGITASFTAEPVADALSFLLNRLGLKYELEFAPYNQIFQQLLDPSSLVSFNREGVNIVLLRLTDWLRFDEKGSSEAGREKIEHNIRELAESVRSFTRRNSSPLIICLCPPERRFLEDRAWAEFLSRMENSLANATKAAPGIHLIKSEETFELYPIVDYSDEYADKIGHVPYSSVFFAALGAMLARKISGMRRPPYKVVVLDCDNTLWRGVCGEDGALGVTIDDSHRALQQFLLTQQGAGMILCLCSKNSEEDVQAVFERNPGMLIRDEDIVASRINWNPKSQNLRELALELQLGLDSFIFIDDNPLECEEVRAHCPEVLTIELPRESAEIPKLLQHVWAFDQITTSLEDRNRTGLYKQNVQREQIRNSAASLEEFLIGLDLKVIVRPMADGDLGRVAQLTQRTNQFNFTTVRRSEREIRELCDAGSECLVVDLCDRFGDYGLTGVLIFSTQPGSIVLDTFLLSCRALGRKVEHRMLANLGEIALSRGRSRVDVPYIDSRKNQPALNFIESIGAQFKGESGGKTIYRFPAEYAASAATLVVAEESSKSADLAEAGAIVAPALGSNQSRILGQLALELQDIAKFAHTLESQKTAHIAGSQLRVAPRTPTEEIVAGIWARLLKTDKISVHDDFFSLGGHSLLGTQVVARIRQALWVELELRALFECPTIAKLSARVEEERRKGSSSHLPPLKPGLRGENLPISFAQQRLWFLEQLEPGNPLYNVPQMFRMRGVLKLEVLKRSLDEIVHRHESLRTRFETRNNHPVQVIEAKMNLPVSLVDLQVSSGDRELDLRRLAIEEALRPFDLSKGPLLRATLVRLADEDHALFLTMHHIVSDRWSMGVLSEELGALYSALSQGVVPSLHDLPIQYADFAAWQRSWLQGTALDEQLAYWKKQLAGAPRVLELPTSRTRPAVQTFRGSSQSRILSHDLVEQLAAFSQREGATLFMTLLASFQVMLSRYSGQEDIVVGSPIANRNFAEIEPLIGFFVNTLALRTDLSGDPSFKDLLARVKESALQAYAHQDLPFEKLVEELQPQRSLSYNPIFQVMFALQNAPMQKLELPGLELERVPVYPGTSMFDMSWFIIEVPEGLLVRAEYNTDLFDDSIIVRALEHFENLLHGVVADSQQRISQLPLIGDEERHTLLVELNSTDVEFPSNLSTPELFELQAKEHPESIAAVCGIEQLTYRELNRKANQLAHYLRSRGAQPDALIGLYLERSLDMLVALLGVLKAGAAYVPLDPAYPNDRIAFIAEDAQLRLLITQESLVDSLPAQNAEVIRLDSDWSSIIKESSADPAIGAKAENLAYVLYTSGSTGKPKGVQIEHRNLVNFLASMQQKPGFSSQDVLLAVTTLSFDIAGLELYLPLVTGAKVVIASREQSSDGQQLLQLLHDSQATVMQATPATWRLLIESGWSGDGQLKVLCGGEALTRELAEQLMPRCAELWNMYGPTETTIWSSLYRVQDLNWVWAPIGRPIANTQMYVLDKTEQPMPIGVPGELYIGGDGLARGYWKRPELTAEKFVADPFRKQAGARLYRTGDLTRYLADGNLQYLSRIDNQVKVRGFRIELGEVESVLVQHSQVRQAVVTVREDLPGDKRLVAYLILAEGCVPDQADLRSFLRETLPDYMLPSRFVTLEALPLTPNGKVDRKALPAPPSDEQSEVEAIAPRDEFESGLVTIFENVLVRKPVGVNDDFFELGGHSLLATQVISRIRESFRVSIPLRALFETPTVAALARRIQDTTPSLDTAPIRRLSRGSAIPLSFAQQRLWFLDQLEPGNPLYNIPWTLCIEGCLDVAALERSLNRVTERHESLRTNFIIAGDQPVQVIHPSVSIELRIEDLSNLSDVQQQSESQRLNAREAQRPFQLSNGPLLRAMLVRLHSERHILLFTIHHIVSDRWSMGLLAKELASFYAQETEGKSVPLPELPIQSADFAVWQREWLSGDNLESHLSYWRERLHNSPPVLELPTDRPRLATESFRGATLNFEVSGPVTDKLNSISRSHDATLFMTLLAGFDLLLSNYTGQEDIVVGTPIANRNRSEVENLIGFFANTVPLRTNLAGDPTFADLLSRAKETALEAYAHQDLPFEKLVEELRPERSLSHNPLVQVFFVLQNAPLEAMQLKGLQLTAMDTDTKTSKGDMFLSLFETPNGLRGRLEYNTDLFDQVTVERMARHFQTLLAAIASNPDRHLSELPVLDQQELDQLVIKWNDTGRDYPRNRCLHQAFEVQAAKSPNAVAVAFDDQSLTYRELNERSNRLAHYLRQRGAKPKTLIGVYVDRSLEMIIALLAVQKTGAAYVPLDPAYPAERLRSMMEDGQFPLLITQESLLRSIPVPSDEVVCLGRDNKRWEAENSNNLDSEVSPEDLVYVIFTSGSTGRPKGVQVPHRAVVNLLTSMGRELRMGEKDTLVALASFAFDMCIPELYLPLVTGGKVVIGRRELASDGEALAALLNRTGATMIHATPTTWSLLLEAGYTGAGRKRVVGAEPLPKELCARLLKSDSSLFNFYGPTETTVWSTFHEFRSQGEALTIGRPLANTQVYILDKHQRPVPIGVAGELYIGGDGVTKGYLNRPELTAEKFVINPFSSDPAAKLYRTGDLSRYLPDGRIEFLGRIDNQVKLRGFRIELGEIEAVLSAHPGVKQSVATIREDRVGDKRLVAYFTPSDERVPSTSELRTFAGEKLPDYMVPSRFVVLDKFQLNANGKVNRQALPVPESVATQMDEAGAAPRTPIEELLTEIWEQVLRIPHIGIFDNFFTLGGHSLLATQVVSRIRQVFQVELPLRSMFEAPTVAALAERIENLRRQEQGLQAPPLTRVPRHGSLPLSFAQQRLWFLDQLEPNNPLYNVPNIMRLRGVLNTEALEHSLERIIERHETLRTTFQTEDDQPVQIIAPHVNVPPSFLDLTAIPASERDDEARKRAMEEVKHPFNLSSGPLLRALLFKLDEQDHVLILNTHHIISDRWSMAVLLSELAALYEAELEGRTAKLPDLTIQYADYAVWQRDYLSGSVMDEQLAYWRKQLEGAPNLLELPTDRPRRAIESFWGGIHRQDLPADLVKDLRAISRRSSATFFMTLMAAFQALLAWQSDQKDVVVGTDLANRTQLETEKLIGFFVNLLPIRVKLSEEWSFAQLLDLTRDTSLGAFAHQDLPFEKLVEELRPERSLTHNPLVQVLFVMQNIPQVTREFGGLKVGTLGVSSTSRFDLVLFINDPEGSPYATWMYNPNLFDASTIGLMASLYDALLRSVAMDPEITLNALGDRLAEAEKEFRASEQKKFQEASMGKLKGIKRRPVPQS